MFILAKLTILIILVTSCKSTIDLDISSLTSNSSEDAPSGPPIDLSTNSILWSTSNPYYTMFGSPDIGGRSNDLWLSDGTEAGSIVLKSNPDDGRIISNCSPQDLSNFDGGANIQVSRYDLDGDGDYDSVEILRVNSDFSYTILATITKPELDQDIYCYYSASVGTIKLFQIGSSDGINPYDNIWRTDGTIVGTYTLGGVNNGGYGNELHYGPFTIDQHSYFVLKDSVNPNDKNLIRTDGTSFERIDIPGVSYPWGQQTDIEMMNNNIYILFETAGLMAHIDSDEVLHTYIPSASAHTNFNYTNKNFFSKNNNFIFLESSDHNSFPHQYINKIDNKIYPVGPALTLPNIPFMVNDTGVYFYEDLGGGNYEIKKSTDMATLTSLGSLALPQEPQPYMTLFDNRYLLFEHTGEQYIFDTENITLNSPTFISNCSEADFNNVAQLGYNSKVREIENIYYACTSAPNVAFARYNLTDHTTDVFVEYDMMAEMSNEYRAMAFVQNFVMNYFNVMAFYKVNEGQIIGATPFQ